MQGMDIVIIANYEEENGGNSRFVTIANMLKKNNNVEIITSTFSHMEKKQKENLNYVKDGIKWTHCKESGYQKNICLKRFVSHSEFGKNVKKYLSTREKPDFIYLAIPSLNVGDRISDYCKKNGVRLIVDIQDLWPEAFRMVFNPLLIGNIIYLPFTKQANKIYRSADAMVAVSHTYLERGLSVNKNLQNTAVVYLGTDKKKFDEIAQNNEVIRNNGVLKLVYAGTLGSSYSLDIVIKALAKLKEKNDYELVIMGDGPRKQEFLDLAEATGITYKYLGYLPYEQMVMELIQCDIAVNPIVDNAAQSIINKVGDYAMAALPVINTQTCPEYRNEIKQRNIGINCHNNIDSICDAIIQLKNENLRKTMGDNNRKWAEEEFDREKSYQKITAIFNRMAK